jgi:hypothetical protein
MPATCNRADLVFVELMAGVSRTFEDGWREELVDRYIDCIASLKESFNLMDVSNCMSQSLEV